MSLSVIITKPEAVEFLTKYYALSKAEAEDIYGWFLADYEKEMKERYVNQEKQEEWLGTCVELYLGA